MNIAQSLENLRLEQDAIVLYDALASIEREPRRAAAFRQIADNERRHAEIWADRLRELGATVPPPGRPRARIRLIVVFARLFGTRFVSDMVKALEGDEEAVYAAQEPHPAIASIAADERVHAEIWRGLDAERKATGGRKRPRRGAASDVVAAGHPPLDADVAVAPESIARAEGWHRSARSGTLRATIFGVSARRPGPRSGSS